MSGGQRTLEHRIFPSDSVKPDQYFSWLWLYMLLCHLYPSGKWQINTAIIAGWRCLQQRWQDRDTELLTHAVLWRHQHTQKQTVKRRRQIYKQSGTSLRSVQARNAGGSSDSSSDTLKMTKAEVSRLDQRLLVFVCVSQVVVLKV